MIGSGIPVCSEFLIRSLLPLVHRERLSRIDIAVSHARKPARPIVLQRERVVKGVLVRLTAKWITVPPGTTGTVDEIGTLRSGEWWFLVNFDPHLPVPLFPLLNATPQTVEEGLYSLRLWESDLEKFEVITLEERRAALAEFVDPRIKTASPRPLLSRPSVNQLLLPFESHQEVRGTWFCE